MKGITKTYCAAMIIIIAILWFPWNSAGASNIHTSPTAAKQQTKWLTSSNWWNFGNWWPNDQDQDYDWDKDWDSDWDHHDWDKDWDHDLDWDWDHGDDDDGDHDWGNNDGKTSSWKIWKKYFSW